MQPAAVGDDGIDLTVVSDVAERLRKMPGRLRVGRIALVENGKGGGERRIAQVFVELGELPGREQAFIDDGLRGERADVTSRRQERFGAFSEEREAPLEARRCPGGMKRLDEKLPNFGHGFKSTAAQGIGVYRNATPADDTEALGVSGGFDGRASFIKHGGRKKGEADGEHFRQLDSLLLRAGAEESLGERSEQSGAVAAGSIGINAAAMGETL